MPLQAAREHVENTIGKILDTQPGASASHVRIARWTGVPTLVARDKGIAIDEEILGEISIRSGANLIGYLRRKLVPTLHNSQQEFLLDWLKNLSFEFVPLDALLALDVPMLDWWPDTP